MHRFFPVLRDSNIVEILADNHFTHDYIYTALKHFVRKHAYNSSLPSNVIACLMLSLRVVTEVGFSNRSAKSYDASDAIAFNINKELQRHDLKPPRRLSLSGP